MSDVCISTNIVKTIARGTNRALAYLHGQKIIHRDIKPSNILLSSDMSVKLCDFGLAIYSTETNRDRSGTCYYMAPEVVNKIGWCAESDMWALGCSIYELMAGKKLFNGRKEKVYADIAAYNNDVW